MAELAAACAPAQLGAARCVALLRGAAWLLRMPADGAVPPPLAGGPRSLT